ncbi:hypothetical protein GCM10022381_12860 [Leifsonia kafniensis]|uniref:Type I restriction modification DNA specificity domain-containing protein n=1 Tax=Leifsonia kafniensis TaxID=475957 RepID=A0ABP7KAH9_9MICO
MSKVRDLIERLAPDGVRYASLSEIATTVSGLTGKSKLDFTGGNARYVSYKNVFANATVDAEAPDFVTVAVGERQNALHAGDVVFTVSSENFEDVGMSAVLVQEPVEPLYLNSFCFALRFNEPDLLPEFSKYLFRSELVRSQIRKTASGVTRINVSKSRFMRIRVPVPPLDVQREIAWLLDSFSELENELIAELEARREQRLAVRGALVKSKRLEALDPEGGVRTRIGDIATKYVDPVRVAPEATYTNLGVKWYGEGAFARAPKLGSDIKAATLYRVKPGQFIYNRMFVTEGSFGLVTQDLAHGVVSNEFPSYDLDPSRVIPEWLYLHFQTPAVVNAAASETTGGTKSRRRWKEEQFEAFEIELPSLAAQREIVERVGAASELIAVLEEELALRQVQFVYYRDRLLAFEELVA